MCGITGFIENKNLAADELLIRSMTQELRKRGPDNEGYLINKNVAIGHSRLSIIDLSDKSNQPVRSKSGRYIISFNGEIYNFKKIHNKYKLNPKYQNSDTLTLLNCLELIGVDKTLENISGMFAISIIDLKNNKLYLVRDIAGEKPIYYGFVKVKKYKTFIFGSQISCFSKYQKSKIDINKNSLNNFLDFGFIPGEDSIYKNIKKIKPGHYLCLDINTNEIIFQKKWFNNKINFNDNFDLDIKNFDNAKKILKKKLVNSIIERSVSDVPLGAHLSGGIDSTLICSILAKENINFETFTIGFNNSEYDESNYAEKISNYINIKNNKLIISDKDIINSVDKLSYVYDEPFADSSQIPSAILSNYASNKVKVMITGDGADELFGGYNRHIYLNRILEMGTLQVYIYKNLINLFFIFQKYKYLKNIMNLILGKIFNNPSEKILKFNNILKNKNFILGYLNLLSSENTFKNFDEKLINLIKLYDDDKLNNTERLMNLDFNLYLPDDILIKSDKASMYYGLENRAPYLNDDLIFFSKKIPFSFKINKNKGKIILKSLLSEYIPDYLISRPKQGFAVPLKNLLKTSLRDWATDLINTETVTNIIPLKKEINIILKKDNISTLDEKKIWNLLMFQLWYTNSNKKY